jgi:hypothetical protein
MHNEDFVLCTGSSFPGDKQQECEFDHSSPSSTGVKNASS